MRRSRPEPKIGMSKSGCPAHSCNVRTFFVALLMRVGSADGEASEVAEMQEIVTNRERNSKKSDVSTACNKFRLDLPTVGMVVTRSFSFNLYKIDVFPAASSPTITIRASFVRIANFQINENKFPIWIFEIKCWYLLFCCWSDLLLCLESKSRSEYRFGCFINCCCT